MHVLPRATSSGRRDQFGYVENSPPNGDCFEWRNIHQKIERINKLKMDDKRYKNQWGRGFESPFPRSVALLNWLISSYWTRFLRMLSGGQLNPRLNSNPISVRFCTQRGSKNCTKQTPQPAAHRVQHQLPLSQPPIHQWRVALFAHGFLPPAHDALPCPRHKKRKNNYIGHGSKLSSNNFRMFHIPKVVTLQTRIGGEFTPFFYHTGGPLPTSDKPDSSFSCGHSRTPCVPKPLNCWKSLRETVHYSRACLFFKALV